jgi:hypothetical protein
MMILSPIEFVVIMDEIIDAHTHTHTHTHTHGDGLDDDGISVKIMAVS